VGRIATPKKSNPQRSPVENAAPTNQNQTKSNQNQNQRERQMTTLTPNNTPIFHADHGFQEEHLALLDEVVAQYDGFFLHMLELPEGVASLQCALHGPSVGDEPIGESEVDYVVRNNRPGPSRMVSRPTRETRKACVIGDAEKNVIYTAYGTRAAFPTPREWWDASMKPGEAESASKFWKEHALSAEV
jgi:hypothetical protein